MTQAANGGYSVSVSAAYAARAAEYLELLGTMDAVHPSDRQVVDTWASSLTGPALDAGCGPGHWTDHLARQGVAVRGLDVTPVFIEHARRSYPGRRFDLGSIDHLDEQNGALDGVLSWFSTIHHAPDRIRTPLAEFARVLAPAGTLLLGHFHGDAVEPFEHAVTTAYRWPTHALESLLTDVGLDVLETHTRTGHGQRPVGAILARRR